jgi:hypothetical protein
MKTFIMEILAGRFLRGRMREMKKVGNYKLPIVHIEYV